VDDIVRWYLKKRKIRLTCSARAPAMVVPEWRCRRPGHSGFCLADDRTIFQRNGFPPVTAMVAPDT
jgi:hypothetical protein